MIPEPQPSPDEPSKPKNLGSVSKTGDHHDPREEFWDLDDAPVDPAEEKPVHRSRPDKGPLAREDESSPAGFYGAESAKKPRPVASSEHVKKGMSSNQAAAKQDKDPLTEKAIRSATRLVEPTADFEPLDGGQEPKPEPVVKKQPVQPTISPQVPVAPFEAPEDEKAAKRRAGAEDETDQLTLAGEDGSGSLKSAVVGSGRYLMRRFLRFSRLEQACWLLILLGVTGFGAVLFFPALDELMHEKDRVGERDFPIEGKHLTVLSAKTYWREPVKDGPDADVFRRGTALLPVIELEVEGGPAALRILFRDDDGRPVGDTKTVAAEAGQIIKVSATAGFAERGMFAEYRTGYTDAWTIQVFDAGDVTAQPEEFRKVFEMDVAAIHK